MRPVLRHMTRKGPVFIAVSDEGHFHIVWKDEDLGSYKTPAMAIDDACSARHLTPADGTDLSGLAISADPCDWEIVSGR